MWGRFEEAMLGEKAGCGEGMWRWGGGGRGGFMVVVVVVVEVETEEGLRRSTAGVWSETERGSPAAKESSAEPVKRRERQ